MPNEDRIALVLASTLASGTERRQARVFRILHERYPENYHLILSREVFDGLNRSNFGLDELNNVHVLGPRSPLDQKKAAEQGWLTNLGRSHTLWRYRREIRNLIRRYEINTIQVSLEMVPFLGILPIREARTVTSLVSHLPRYYDGQSLDSRLLLRGLHKADRVDSLYRYITDNVLALGVDPAKVNSPKATCVDHDRFRPAPKKQIVTFVARAFLWKNPQLMLRVIHKVNQELPGTQFFVMGEGPALQQLIDQKSELQLQDNVVIGHHDRPDQIVNRSLVHVCLEEYDNSPNQSTLEGMAAGCALIASDVGYTREVVTPDVGRLVGFDDSEIAFEIIDLLQNPQNAESLGVAGRAKILREFNTEQYIDYLLKLHDFNVSEPIVNGSRSSFGRIAQNSAN